MTFRNRRSISVRSAKPRRRLRLEALEDRSVPAVFMVTNTNDSGDGSLRKAIDDANLASNQGEPDRIEFAITGSGVHSISPATALPNIVDPVVIDGYSQPGSSRNTLAAGNNAVLLIELNGGGLSASGLTLNAGDSTIQGLVINRFEGQGIRITGSNNVVVGNFVGTDSSGASSAANASNGILIEDSGGFGAFNNIIGGDAPGDRNRLAFNGSDGVRITGSNSTGNQILGNEIFANGALGIDLDGDGVTPNDDGDGDFGANALQNFPVLTTAVTDGQRTTVTGTFDGFFSEFTLRFYSSPAADASEFGEGQSFLGARIVPTDADGASFKFVFPFNIPEGHVISATATDQAGNTSEFSRSIAVTTGLHPTARTLDTLVLDLDGNGLDLTGETTTSLLNGQAENVRWTKPNTDDAFLVLNATSLRTAGFGVMDLRGGQIDGNVLFRDGLRIKSPGGGETFVTDGWQLLGVLDSNGDGKIDASDPAWQHLKLFVDANADGEMSAGELADLASKAQSLPVPFDPVAKSSADGGRNENWIFIGADGVTRAASNTWLPRPNGTSTAPASYNWIGVNSNDWYDAGNWSLGNVPSMVDAAVIGAGTPDHGSATDYLGRLTVHGGVVTGTGGGVFNVTRLTLTGGTFDGDGTTNVAAGGSFQFRGLNDKIISTHRLVLSGQSAGHRRYDPLVLDLNGDGLNLTGRVQTNLLTGTTDHFRWTKQNTDDAFLVVDATSLRSATGDDLLDYTRGQINGDVLFAAGLRLRGPDRQDQIITDGWQLLGAFDKNNDGKINASDPVFHHLKLFVDKDADGAIIPTELVSLSLSSVVALNINLPPIRSADGAGNTRADGTFGTSDGTTRKMSDVSFASFGRLGTSVRLADEGTVVIPHQGRLLHDTAEVIGFKGDGLFQNEGLVSVRYGRLHLENGSSRGVWDLDSDGVLDLAGSFDFNQETRIGGEGHVRIDPIVAGADSRVIGGAVRFGHILMSPDAVLAAVNGATVTIGDGVIEGEVSADATSTVRLDGKIDVRGGTLLAGSGKFIIGNDAPALSNVIVRGTSDAANLTVGKNGSLTVLGNLIVQGDLIVEDGGTLRGAQREAGSGLATGRRIVGNVVNDSGNVVPDALTIDGDYTQKVNGTLHLDFELGGAASPTNSRLEVTGDVTLAGKLVLSAPAGFSPAPGASFTLMTYDSVSGKFDRIDGLDYDGGRLAVFVFEPQELRAEARAANPGPNYTDTDGDTAIVRLIGPGRADVFLDDPDGDGRGPIQHIRLTGTNDRTSRLLVIVKKAAAGDGLMSIGSIEGSGIAGIIASKSNLVGSFGHGIEIDGVLAGLMVRDILNGTDVLAGGDPTRATLIFAHVIDAKSTIDLGTAISSFTAATITDGTIRTPRLGALRVIGDRLGGIVGNFSGQVFVTGAGPIAIGSVTVLGAVTNSLFNIQGGRVVSFNVGSFIDSRLFVGFLPTDQNNPMLGGTFTPGSRIDSFRVKGKMDGSTAAADSINVAIIGEVVTDNAGEKFGLLADTKIGLVVVTKPKLKLTGANLPHETGDFQVKLI